MNTVESSLREALHEAMDDVHVTDADVARLESAVAARQAGVSHRESSRRTWRMVALAAAVVVTAAVGVAQWRDDREPTRPAGAPQSDQPLVPGRLVGTWRNVPDSPWVWVITADGRVAAYSSADEYLAGEFGNQVVRRSGDLFTMKAGSCDEVWRVRSVNPGTLVSTFLESSCETPAGEELSLERISPEPYLGGALSPNAGSDDAKACCSSPFIHGIWLHVETGRVLAIGNPRGSTVVRYVLDDDGDGVTNPDQRGRVTLPEGGPPVFRPDTSDARGCVLAFSSFSIVDTTMTTTSEGGGCLPAGKVQWVRVS